MRWNVTTGPTTEPLTLALAKAHLKVEHSEDDTMITAMIIEARSWCEQYTRRALIEQTVTVNLDVWPIASTFNPQTAITLPLGKAMSVTTFTHVDSDGATQALSGPSDSPVGTDWQEDLSDAYGGVLWPPYESAWPDAREQMSAITIVFQAGYGAAASAVPQELISAIKYRLTELYTLRGPTDLGTKALAGQWQEAAHMMARKYRINPF